MKKISKFLQGTVFETQKEYDDYMKEHPKSDKTKHSVKKQIGHDVDHPAYNDRVTIPKHNGKANIFSPALSLHQKGKMLIKNKPDWSAKDHADLAKIHDELSNRAKKEYLEKSKNPNAEGLTGLLVSTHKHRNISNAHGAAHKIKNKEESERGLK